MFYNYKRKEIYLQEIYFQDKKSLALYYILPGGELKDHAFCEIMHGKDVTSD